MIADAVLIVLCGVVLLGAGIAVFWRNVFYNALGMGLAFLGLAGVYLYLNAEFLAAMQVIIYVGAIAVAILFAIMLSRPIWAGQDPSPPRDKLLRAGAISLAIFAGLCRLLCGTAWTPAPAPAAPDYSAAAVGRTLLTPYAFPFEIISLVLLIAVIGALALSREDRP